MLVYIGGSGLEEAEYSCVMIAQSLRKDKHEKPPEGPYVLIIAYGHVYMLPLHVHYGITLADLCTT